MSPPSLVVRVELEAQPVVVLDVTNEGEEQRLRDWLVESGAIFVAATQLLRAARDMVIDQSEAGREPAEGGPQ
jgi:hypothetical protein